MSSQLIAGALSSCLRPPCWPVLRRVLILVAVATWAATVAAPALAAPVAAWSWGGNNKGQLGNGLAADRTLPAAILAIGGRGPMAGAAGLAGGTAHSVILLNDGTLASCGDNARGELGSPGYQWANTSVAVVGPGVASRLTGISQIACGLHHTIALKADGTVWAWGDNLSRQLGDNTRTVRFRPVQVVGPGGAGYLGDIVAISAASNCSMALASDGSVWTWGAPILGNGTGGDSAVPVRVIGPGGAGFLADIVGIACGVGHMLALRDDGTVWAWGANDRGELGDGTGGAPGAKSYWPVQVKGLGGAGYLADVRAVAASWSSYAVLNDGTVVAWGLNDHGQLGDGSLTFRTTPVQVKGPGGVGTLSGIKSLACGTCSAVAVGQDGGAWSWGLNDRGQLGIGGAAGLDVRTPTAVRDALGVNPLSGVIAVAAGDKHSLALTGQPATFTFTLQRTAAGGAPLTTGQAHLEIAPGDDRLISSARLHLPSGAADDFPAAPGGAAATLDVVDTLANLDSHFANGLYRIETFFTNGTTDDTFFTRDSNVYPDWATVIYPAHGSTISTLTPTLAWTAAELNALEVRQAGGGPVVFAAGAAELAGRSEIAVPDGILELGHAYELRLERRGDGPVRHISVSQTDFSVASRIIRAGVDRNWVYQNTPVTTGNRHHCILTVYITGLTGYSVYIQQSSGPGSIVVEPTGSPLTWKVRGGLRQVSGGGVGSLMLNVRIYPADSPVLTIPLTLTVRALGDLDGVGGVGGQDKLQMNRRLNGLVPLCPEHDLDGLGGCSGQDKLILNKILSGLPIP